MIIQSIPVKDINPASYNPRKDLKPGDKEYEKLKRSIKEFDIVEPLVWNKRTKNLVGGHQRLKILINELHAKEVDVSVVDLTLQKEKALNVALNKISGEWDMPSLESLLMDLNDGIFDVTLTGFDESELKKILDFDGKTGLTDDDAVPDVPKTPKTKKGDIYVLGKHLLMCGDATHIDDVNKLLDGNLADLVFTDPPYNVEYEGHRKKRDEIKNDSMSVEEFRSFLIDTFASYRMAIKEGASLYVCHPSSFQREFQNALEETGFEIRSQIVWAKNHFTISWGRYHFQHEPIFYAHLKDQDDAWYGDKGQATLWHENKPHSSLLHPTMKPVELILRALTNSSKAGDLVVDFFGGSGSTLIAAEKLGRHAAIMEIDPKYCDVIVKRWEDFTGKKAELQKEKVAAQ